MEVKVTEIKSNLKKLKNNISKFEQAIMDMNNIFNSLSTCWNDAKASVFFEEINSQKKAFDIQIEQLQQTVNIYSSIISQYNEFGNNIYFDLDQKESIENMFNQYINKLNSINGSYNNLNLWFNPPEKWMILNDKNLNNKVINELENIKAGVRMNFINIEKIEKNIVRQISKADITFLNPIEVARITNASSNTGQTKDVGLLDVDKFKNLKDKLYMVKGDLEIYSDSIIASLNSINLYYKTSNTTKLEELKTDIKKALNKITKNMENCIFIIERTDKNYEEAKEQAIKNFENI